MQDQAITQSDIGEPPPTALSPGTRIRYMGNKRELAAEVAGACESLPSGLTLVDLFGGMCNVAGAVASSGRPVHVNDIQGYAELAARCLVTAPAPPPAPTTVAAMLRDAFERNRSPLRQRFARALDMEREALDSRCPRRLRALAAQWPHAAGDAGVAAEVRALRDSPQPPARLCTLTFAMGYFGLAQSIDLDSLRFAIDSARRDGRLSPPEARWLLLALLQSASRVASSPGHFAQFLRPDSPASAERIVAYRRRSVWDWFLEDVAVLRPYGTPEWRAGNATSRRDALRAVTEAPEAARGRPAIFYADPPYSKEHYSRFYHALETLARYDYPDAHGAGRYRPDRFRSEFAVRRQVHGAMAGLFGAVARRRGKLLFSYPTNGLLAAAGGDVGQLLESHFRRVELIVDRAAVHSTLGARHGRSRRPVREQVWLAR